MSNQEEARYKQIGVDRLIRLEWLERTAKLAMMEDDPAKITEVMRSHIQDEFTITGSSLRSSIDKTLTILKKIWVQPHDSLLSLRDSGLELLRSVNKGEGVAVHWGMMMAAYPFWGSVAASVGRLLSLQDRVSGLDVQRRLREKYGDREIVSRCTKIMLNSYSDWGVLARGKKKSIYFKSRKYSLNKPELIAWLLAAYLYSIPDGKQDLPSAMNSTSLFPFSLMSISSKTLTLEYPGLQVFQHGLDQVVIMLNNKMA